MAAQMSVADEGPEIYHTGPERLGRPERFFVPDYPPEALAKGITGYVDVEGEVDGKPKISLEMSKAGARSKSIKPASCPEPEYPRDSLRNGLMANVYSRLDLRVDGTVAQVATDVYPKRGLADERFANAVKNAFEQCKFPPATDSQPPRVACYDVLFRTAP